jgi:glycosyltransferase involved in cell wall biosynthesis
MKLVIVCDSFPPSTSSASIQLKDLSLEFKKQGFNVYVITPAPNLIVPWKIENINSITVIKLKILNCKKKNLYSRAIQEISMPFFMLLNLRKIPDFLNNLNFLVWYSPTIFFGPFIFYLKKKYSCPTYLILRDIFPEWALEIGIMKKNLPYFFFKLMANIQYLLADKIGIQSKGNIKYLKYYNNKVEILDNWISNVKIKRCSIDLSKTKLSKKTIFVYTGNIGLAQNLTDIVNLAEQYKNNPKIGFVFVGRGTLFDETEAFANSKNLNNILFFDEIRPDEIPLLLAQCDIGIISLNLKHKSHNIPGKLLSYLSAGLPILAHINENNDLEGLIEKNNIGYVSTSSSIEELKNKADLCISLSQGKKNIKIKCHSLINKKFSSKAAAKKILRSLN